MGSINPGLYFDYFELLFDSLDVMLNPNIFFIPLIMDSNNFSISLSINPNMKNATISDINIPTI